MAELSNAFAAGMTPIISYWSGDMLWLDGKGNDQQGPCAQDNPTKCKDSVKFYGFSITNIDDPKPLRSVKKDDHESHNSNEASTTSKMDSHKEFCCFAGPCGNCSAKAESN